MSRTSLFLLAAILLVFAVSLVAIFRPSPPVESSATSEVEKYAPQENSGGEVDITVTPLSLAVGVKPQFEIEFNTHSVELDFDIEKLASLSDDKNNLYANPTWEGSPPGGHHRSGKLTFGDSLKDTSSVTLVLRDISGVSERKFIWQL